VSRLFRTGNRRLQVFMEVFNLLNQSTIFTRNGTVGSQFYQPVDLVEPRRFRSVHSSTFNGHRQHEHAEPLF
jgi:hypothetical protein